MLYMAIGLLFAGIIVIGMVYVSRMSSDSPSEAKRNDSGNRHADQTSSHQQTGPVHSEGTLYAGEKTIEELRSDPHVKEVEILGTTKLRATYENGEVKIYQRSFD